jgi:hypothetical protein
MNTDVKPAKKGKWHVLTEEKHQGDKLEKRRYVRLDIASPVDIKLLVPASGESKEPGLIPYKGEILNVSAGGILVESSEAVPEGDYIVMDLELNGTDKLTGVVGKIKRCDSESEKVHLIGVEFCSDEDIEQNCPPEYRKLLGERCTSFSEKVRTLISKYVFNESVQRQAEREG